MSWRAIKAKAPPDIDRFTAQLEKEAIKAFKPAQSDFQSFVSTWKNKPTIILESKRTRTKIMFFTGVVSRGKKGTPAKPEDIFKFLARGTKVRYARMTNDFVAKTKVRVIQSGPGRGGLLARTPGVPFPGIEARQIENVVLKKREKQIAKDIREAFAKIAKKNWGW